MTSSRILPAKIAAYFLVLAAVILGVLFTFYYYDGSMLPVQVWAAAFGAFGVFEVCFIAVGYSRLGLPLNDCPPAGFLLPRYLKWRLPTTLIPHLRPMHRNRTTPLPTLR